VARDIAQEVSKVVRPKVSTTTATTSLAAASAQAPTAEPSEPATKKAPKAVTLTKPKKHSGATDLTKGNKVEPGQTGTVSTTPEKNESEAAQPDPTTTPQTAEKPAAQDDNASDGEAPKEAQKAAA
jgi:hypothetical protein